MLLDVDRGEEEMSMVIGAGHHPAVILDHLRFCVESGLLLFPEEGGDVFEAGFPTPARVTEKGRRFLVANIFASSTVTPNNKKPRFS